MSVPILKNKRGFSIPGIGLGTWQAAKGEVLQAVKTAIDVGYRHIDCAYIYGNEDEVGEAIAAKIADRTVRREDLFITTKLWNSFHEPKDVRAGCQESLKNLKLDYVDLFLMHSPMGSLKGPDGKSVFTETDYVDTWKAMEPLVGDGLCKAIGISNFNSKQITRILESCRIPPANLQIESSPYITNQQLVDFAHSHDITVTAFSPLGNPSRPSAKPDDPTLLEEPLLKQLGEKYKKSPAQILIRFQLYRGVAVLAKSVKEHRLKENLNVLGFSLTSEEVSSIAAFNRNFRAVGLEMMKNHKHFPLNEPF